jgi:hypothetical protein
MPIKGSFMTRTALFAGPAHATESSLGQRRSSASSLVPKALDAAQAMFTAPADVAGASSDPRFPWLTAGMRGNMSARAQRLMRADY